MREAAQGGLDLEGMCPAESVVRFRQPDPAGFEACPSISADHAVLEKSRNVVAKALLCAWSDVGSWSAFAQVVPADEQGNRVEGQGVLREASNTYVRALHRPVVALGTRDLIIVDTPDALLVAHRDHEQELRQAVDDLRNRGVFEATSHRKSKRPWGWYDVIDRAPGFVVKRIGVKPGASLSLQMHYHRAEHWVVLQGTAEVTCAEKVFLLGQNESTYIPLGAVHRLRNPGKIELQVLEVQTGAYLHEDDIVRLQDRYGRTLPGQPGKA
jgi:mannose-1-phosphate guanylyltransferase/mannose-6-phosphate isomerase